MCKLVFSVLLFVLTLNFQIGNAEFECPVSAVSSLAYFDLEQLSIIADGFNNVIQTPLACGRTMNDCINQQCCPDEVGCCHMNTKKCGCKRVEDETCKYPPPLIVLANSECDSDTKRKISACLRPSRENEENTNSLWNTTLKPVAEGKATINPIPLLQALQLIFTFK